MSITNLIQLSGGEEIREKVLNFVNQNKPPKVSPEENLDEFVQEGLNWQKKLFKNGIIGQFLPKEFGGQGNRLIHEAFALEALALADSPQLPGIFGITMLAPILLKYGNEIQRKFLPHIFEGSTMFCQCFSEPEAGSDLFNLKSNLTEQNDFYLLNGQKIWTSFARYCGWGFGIAKLAGYKAEKKQEGILFFLVELNQSKNIQIKPIKQISGVSEFSEIFFNDAKVLKDHIVGNLETGWKITLETLFIERVLLTFARHIQTIKLLKKINEIIIDEYRREFEKLLAEFNLLRLTAYKHIQDIDQGKELSGESSIDKYVWSEHFKKSAKIYRLLAIKTKDKTIIEDANRTFLYSLGRTIAAGTSEIQKMTVAHRVLNLPRSF